MTETKRVILVTGASRGLGRAIALAAANDGFIVWAGVRNQGAAEQLRKLAGESAIPLHTVQLDVTDAASIDAAMAEIERTSGTLYGLVNNAGITGRSFFEDYPEAMIRRLFEVNLFGPMNVTRRALPLLRANGCGRIVNISSIGGRIGSNSVAPYVASKFGLEGFSESLAIELRPFDIHVSVISPGIIRTEIWDADSRILPEARNPKSPYYEYFWRMEGYTEKLLASSTVTPQDVAARVLKILHSSHPGLRHVVGWRARTVSWLRKHLPDSVFEGIYFGQFVRLMKRREPVQALPTRAANE